MVAKRYEISFSPEREAFIRSKIDSGEYASADDLFAAALELMEERAREDAAAREKLRVMIAEGLADIDAGRVVDGPVAMAELRQRIEDRAALRNGK